MINQEINYHITNFKGSSYLDKLIEIPNRSNLASNFIRIKMNDLQMHTIFGKTHSSNILGKQKIILINVGNFKYWLCGAAVGSFLLLRMRDEEEREGGSQ